MSDLISRQTVKDIILGGVSTDTDEDKEYVCGLIDNLPSVDIMECARAIKEYCNRKKCDKCPCKSKDPMYICSLSHETPYFWDLPEGEKE